MRRTDRLLSIMLELQEKGWMRALDLATTLEVSTRTIYRDMQALDDAGVPVKAVPGKGYSLFDDYFLPPLSFNTDEALMLLLGSTYMAEHVTGHYQTAARAAQTKLDEALPEALQDALHALRERLELQPINAFDVGAEDSLLSQVHHAITQQRSIALYAKTDGSSNGHAAAPATTVNPYGLVNQANTWYLVGFDHDRQRVQHYRMARFGHLDLLDEGFKRPASYDQIAATQPISEIMVRVHLQNDNARWQREADAFQVIDAEEQTNGVIVTLRVHREAEIIPWLLSWGRHAVILEPRSLRKHLADEISHMQAHYQEAPALLF